MKPNPTRSHSKRGSALLTVVFLTALMAILTGSMLSYTMSERRGNERNRLILRAKNMAENITIYAAEQMTTKLYRLGSAPVMAFPWTGTSRNRVYMPPDQVLDTAFTSHTTSEMRAGIQAATAYVLDNDTSSPNYGLQVSTATVPIIAKSVATHSALGTVTAYVEQDMALSLTPLFQFGMFYNMDLELYPSAAMSLTGPVHTNGRLLAHPQGSSTFAITFTDRFTSAAGVYADPGLKIVPRVGDGSLDPVTMANGDVIFTHTNGTTTMSLKNSSNLWRDHKFTTTSENTTTIANFKDFATNTYNGNLRTSAHGVTKLELPGIGSYKEVDDPSTPDVDERSSGRELIEPPNAKKWVWNTSSSTGAWTANTDDPDAKESKVSWKCGLYIVANPSGGRATATDALPRSATLPDGNTVWVLPYSYRAFLNTIDTSTGVHTVREVVLPGQPTFGYNAGADGNLGTGDDYMYVNYLPNRYATNNNFNGNQVLRIPQQGYGTGTGYLINNSAGYAIGSMVLAVDTGTGNIQPGDNVTIGIYKYLVTSTAPAAGTITIASPGLRVAAVDNDIVTVDWPGGVVGTGKGYLKNGAGALNATTVAVDTGSGTILAGNTITIGSKKYRVTSSTGGSTVTSLVIEAPGLTAAVTDNTPITIDALTGTVGSGSGYLVNKSGGYANAYSGEIILDTGSGTIQPGNVVTITTSATARKYLVASALTNNAITLASPLRAAINDNDTVVVDSTSGTQGTGVGYMINNSGGYAVGATALTLDTGTGTLLPGNILAIGSAKYMVTLALTSGSVSITPALSAAVTDDSPVMLDPFPVSGYSRGGGNGLVFPADSTTLISSINPPQAYFYDMRRAYSNRGVISISGTGALYDRYTIPYVPRPIAKIDVDMARLKMMVQRTYSAATTSAGYDLRAPNDGASTFSHSIYNNGSPTTSTYGLGTASTAFTTFPTTGSTATQTLQDPFRLYYAPTTDSDSISLPGDTDPRTRAVPAAALFDASANCAWYDGIAIYLHSVDAEMRAYTGTVPNFVPIRGDSGVRLWNGRGNVISMTTTGKTGFSFVNNDATYIVGHFNADGNITSATSATGTNGYSARYPDNSTEYLCAVMGDAITIMSQPGWSSATSGQVEGWNDALSALPATSTSSGWRTGGSATAAIVGAQDGLYFSAASGGCYPGLLPTDSISGTLGSLTNLKLGAYDTEVSTALLVGIVPTNHRSTELTDGYTPSWSHTAVGDPAIVGNRVNAGGANNFPRLLENWKPSGTQTLWIRGSMVGMFESRVAMEPFTNSRIYNAPNRYWGLHQNFRTVNHDLPLEPIVLGSVRIGFRELSASQYATMKTTIEALSP